FPACVELGAEVLDREDALGGLAARVIDVVLHFNGVAALPENAADRVTQHDVAQVTHVRFLVRVDGSVLHHHTPVAAATGLRTLHGVFHEPGGVHEEVDVRPYGLGAGHTLGQHQSFHQFGGDLGGVAFEFTGE